LTEKLFTYLKGDRTIWVIAILLSIISLLAVYSSISSLAHKYHDGNTFYYLIKHVIMLGTGFVIMFYVHRMQFKYFYRLSQLLFVAAVILLICTLFFGPTVNEANRWLTIPIINQSFQTSDLAKIVLVVYLARLLTQKKETIRDFKTGFLMILPPVIVICGLILPANFSTAALLFFTCLVIMFTAGVRLVHIFSLIGVAIMGFIMLLVVETAVPGTLPRLETWKARIDRFIGIGDAEQTTTSIQENYQVQMAKIAIYNGGFAPSLPGHAASRNYMPHPYSDMIYAFIIEEYGSIIGGLGLLILYLILFFRIIKIALASQKTFNKLVVLGLGFMMIFQAMVNMAVAVNLFPVTGQPLPMVSMGGTSVWFTCIALGIILSVSRQQSEHGVGTKSASSFA
jgi:cell division protein FtsW